MCDPTKDNIFGTSSESELEQGEDRDVSGSAVASSQKRAAPNGSHRARLTVAMTFFNGEMRNRGETGWLLMDNSSTHGLPADAVPHILEEDGLRL